MSGHRDVDPSGRANARRSLFLNSLMARYFDPLSRNPANIQPIDSKAIPLVSGGAKAQTGNNRKSPNWLSKVAGLAGFGFTNAAHGSGGGHANAPASYASAVIATIQIADATSQSLSNPRR